MLKYGIKQCYRTIQRNNLVHLGSLSALTLYAPYSRYHFSTPGPENLTKADDVMSKFAQQDVGADMAQKVAELQGNQPLFDRLISFDPDFMATLPFWLEWLDPAVEAVKDGIVWFHQMTGMPWWAVIALTCLFVRGTMFPLIFVQFRRTSKLASVIINSLEYILHNHESIQLAPVLTLAKKLTDQSKLNKYQKWPLFLKICFNIIRKQKLKTYRLFIYNTVHFPFLITMIYSIRRLMVIDSVKDESLLWVPSLCAIDPYYIIPFVTIAAYYWNLQRFITKENQHTFISKAKGVGQVLLICWLPILCNWPSAIALYMMSNAVISIFQTSLLVTPAFMRYVDPKMMIYQTVIRLVEYDKKQSDAVADSIKTGEEVFSDKAIKEEDLVEKMKETLEKLDENNYSDCERIKIDDYK